MGLLDVIPFWLWGYGSGLVVFGLFAWLTLDNEKHCQGIWVPWLRSWARAQDVWPWFVALVGYVAIFGLLALRG